MRDRRYRLSRTLVALLLAASLAGAQEEDEEAREKENEPEVETIDSDWRRPLSSRNQIPLSLLFVYLTPDRAGAIPAGDLDVGLSFDYSNVILAAESEREEVRLDLEYLRTLVSIRRGLGGGVEVGASVPLYLYYGGFLDPFVNSFHEAFGFPNFLRGQTPNGLVDFHYRRGDEVLFSGQSAFGAVGDLSFDVKKNVLAEGSWGVALRGALKVPTGDPENLSGSGATDFAAGLAINHIGPRFGIYLNANYHVLGQGERIRTRDFFSFMGGVDWRLKPRLAAVFQADYARPAIEGELPFLNRDSRQLAVGLRFRHSERFLYEWRLVEDLSTFSPDFTFAFQVGIRFRNETR